MSFLVLLDSGPLGMVTNPKESDETRRCKAWLRGLLDAGVRVMVPEIADYEVRRELVRAGRSKGVARLEALAGQVGYLPIDTAVLRRAADLWAVARTSGTPTADDTALDGDVILSAQAQLAEADDTPVVVATTNTKHLERFTDARRWESVGTTLLDPGFGRDMEFFEGVSVDRLVNKDVEVILKAPGSTIEMAQLCRTFVRDGQLWIDLIPDLVRKYAGPIPPDAIVSKNETDLDMGLYGIIIEPTSMLGRLLLNLLEAEKRRPV